MLQFLINYSFIFLKYISAGNEQCPQPQTAEHLAAIEIMKLEHILILQNKIDLVTQDQAKTQYDQILGFVKGIIYSKAIQSFLQVIFIF